jgi:Flp pilus assembly protein TadG
LVEFALILPVLLLLVIGVFDFGNAENRKNNVNFLANTAARYAEVNQCKSCSGSETINTHVANSADFTPRVDHHDVLPERHARRRRSAQGDG